MTTDTDTNGRLNGPLEFGKGIRVLRKDMGLKQEELAVDLDTTQSWVSKVECGLILPPPEKRAGLYNALGVTPDERTKMEGLAVWSPDGWPASPALGPRYARLAHAEALFEPSVCLTGARVTLPAIIDGDVLSELIAVFRRRGQSVKVCAHEECLILECGGES